MRDEGVEHGVLGHGHALFWLHVDFIDSVGEHVQVTLGVVGHRIE